MAKTKNKHLEELVEGVLKENCQLKKVVGRLNKKIIREDRT